jgi:hypothetical protein
VNLSGSKMAAKKIHGEQKNLDAVGIEPTTFHRQCSEACETKITNDFVRTKLQVPGFWLNLLPLDYAVVRNQEVDIIRLCKLTQAPMENRQ